MEDNLLRRESPSLDYRVIHADGKVHNLHAQGIIQSGSVGNSDKSVGTVQDITERTLAEEKVRGSEQKWRSLVSTLPDYVSLLDNESRYLFLNHFAEGFVEADVIGRSAFDFVPEESREILEQKMAECRNARKIQRFELTAFGANSTVRVYDWYLVPILDDNKANGFMVVTRDITERKQAEEEKVKLREQLLQAQKMESVGRLAGGVAHDFNNMLGVILGHTEMALEQVDPTLLLHDDLEAVHRAAERSASLTHQLLAFARRQTAAPKLLDLNQRVQGMLTMLARMIGEDVQLVCSPKAHLWPVKIDPSQLDQILTNLCVNARDAIAEVGTITIETGNTTIDEAYCADHSGAVPGEYVLLAVQDDGRGMGKETQSHLFEPFFTTKEVGKGTGLGLATVFGIVKQNDGFITVESELDNGSTFSIYLPRQTGKAEEDLKQGSAVPASHGQETVLVVEDEVANLKLIRRLLERQGYTVLEAGTPGEAMRVAREHSGEIDLLMTDVIMPEMNGRGLARKLLSLYPDLKCLFMSGYPADVMTNQGVLEEEVSFIQKPFSGKGLADKVRETLER
jgi:PAS domain S-box-containing protein